MNGLIQTVNNSLGVVVFLTIGILIFAAILQAFRQVSIFGGRTSVVVAVCVTILCLMGFIDFLGNPAEPPTEKPVPAADTTNHNRDFHIPFLLIPYVALGLSILGMLLLMVVGPFLHDPKHHRLDDGPNYRNPHGQDLETVDRDRRSKERSRFES
jgi:hypothetical protein